MKIDARRAAAFLRDPGAMRVVLLHGEDGGAIRDRAAALTKAVAGSLDDPFRVAELDRAAHDRLEDEAASLSLTGGRRVVRVRDAGESLAGAVKAILASRADALVILEAPNLAGGGKSKLRPLVEAAPDGAALACYPEEGAALEATIRSALAAEGAGVEPDAVQFLAAQLGSDRGVIQREIEKLALYVGPGGTVDLDAARAAAGDHAALSLDDALHAALAGDAVRADRALDRAMAEGATAVGVLRAALLHVQRLLRLRLGMGRGGNAADAVRAARPPVFFKRVPQTVRALERWQAAQLLSLGGTLSAAERDCKQTGAPADAICRNLLARIARHGSASARMK